MTLLHAALVVLSVQAQDPAPLRVDCSEWRECRQLALDAAARQDYETFHDLAWRAVQTGPKTDPALMYLLARAQSLSGRPGDALVMLERLAQKGVPTDAATNDDFRRVRALPGWAEAEAAFAANAEAATAPDDARPAVEAAPPRARPVAPADTATTPTEPKGAPRIVPEAAPPARASRSDVIETRGETRAAALPAESLRFTTPPFTPAGLAYDAVSRRFIVGDRHARKLAVVDEFSQHVATLASARSTGFGEITGLEIDTRQGNLWVVSAEEPAAAAGADSRPAALTTLHKLQLVSGRSLASYVLPDRFGPARFADVAATADSTVLVLDSAGHRLFQLREKAAELDLVATLPDARASSVAPAADGLVYVAHEGGIAVIDRASRAVSPLKTAKGVDLTGITRLRWHKRGLVAVQQTAPGSYRAISIALDRAGRTATGLQVLDASLPTTDPTAATISGGVLYYLADGDDAEMIVRKVTLP